jgi:hypothetical protein
VGFYFLFHFIFFKKVFIFFLIDMKKGCEKKQSSFIPKIKAYADGEEASGGGGICGCFKLVCVETQKQ